MIANAFGEEKATCSGGFPNDQNYIVSGTLLHDIILCMEKSSPLQPASVTMMTEGQTVAAMKYDCSTYLQSNLFKGKVLSSIYLQFVNKIAEEKVISITFMDNVSKKIVSMVIQSKDKPLEKIDLATIKALPNAYSGYALIQFAQTVSLEPLIPIIYVINKTY